MRVYVSSNSNEGDEKEDKMRGRKEEGEWRNSVIQR